MLEEAWFSAYQVDAEEGLVYLKVWEYGDDEPDWGDVRRQARPGLPYRFTASPAALSYCDAVVDALVRMGLNEADALEILNRRHGELPWLAKDEIDPMRDDFPEWWAEQLAGRSG